ncbi:hypothetical protein NDU88_007578 [Pleurodeles waltl]|uniref:Uncharacterized protein n=1 Tax=Pleurodeles waltl TaxID=8319 RepID=A0AAV7PLR2_PLEWA|nr:hypothetical protein NDU88_007578 [Pleurodeles waltl]
MSALSAQVLRPRPKGLPPHSSICPARNSQAPLRLQRSAQPRAHPHRRAQQPAAPTPQRGRPAIKFVQCCLNKDKYKTEARCPAEPHKVPAILLAG